MGDWEGLGKSDEWYTPRCVFEALDCKFDLDVAPARFGESQVPALLGCSDGLTEKWHGFVWMNPPFGGRNALRPWLRKFVDHGNGIALVPDRTSALWFQEVFAAVDLVLFTKRLKFTRPDGSIGKSPANGTALFAIGLEGCQALRRASLANFGVLARPCSREICDIALGAHRT